MVWVIEDTMLLYQIEDIRMFYENDVRFISQFKKSNFLQ